jgi:hypothetical protein
MAFETEFALLTDHLTVIEGMLNAAKELTEFATEIHDLEVRIQSIKDTIQTLKDLQCNQEISLIKISQEVKLKS